MDPLLLRLLLRVDHVPRVPGCFPTPTVKWVYVPVLRTPVRRHVWLLLRRVLVVEFPERVKALRVLVPPVLPVVQVVVVT